MKKFLIYLSVILVAVSIGFTVFYLVKDNETIAISTSSVYMREGEVIDDLSIMYNKKKSFSDYEVYSSNDNIAKYDKESGKLTAVSGGIATITFRTSNVKFRNLSCQVYVGNGSITSPYYIQNAKQLREIGAATLKEDGTKEVKFRLDKCYKLVANIDLSDGFAETGFWIPIGSGSDNGFTGTFDGNGYTISNININKEKFCEAVQLLGDQYNEEIPNSTTFTKYGLFGRIGYNGRVTNLKINNCNISGLVEDEAKVGAIAGLNNGTIERVAVQSGNIYIGENAYVGGITGFNSSEDATINVDDQSIYTRFVARIDRCSADINLGIDRDHNADIAITGLKGTVGGLVGYNNGGVIIYSYSRGNAHIDFANVKFGYGGIVGYNTLTTYNINSKDYKYSYTGANVQDCYSTMKLYKYNMESANASANRIGGIIGFDNDKSNLDASLNGGVESKRVNTILGNYYLEENLNFVDAGEKTNFNGIGSMKVQGASTETEQPFEDEKYVVMAKLSSEMMLQTTYISHVKTESVVNNDTGLTETNTVEVPWHFGIIWYFSDGVNDGYPLLNFANIELPADAGSMVDGETIETIDQLQNIKLDGNYILSADLDFSEDNKVWTPIGTISNPFVGSLKAGAYIEDGVKNYYKIYNLKTSQSTDINEINRYQYKYAGIFGVTSGAKGGSIENITLINPFICNGEIVGGIVGSNGYVAVVNTLSQTVGGMTIDNCTILGGTITGTSKVGGIVGENFGSVKNCFVENYIDGQNNIKNTTITVNGVSDNYAGGIAGFNSNVVTYCFVGGNTKVLGNSGQNANYTTSVGGIAGQNDQMISYSSVSTGQGGIYIDELKGYAGGVAGINRGSIDNILVNNVSVSAPINKSDVYAGGLVGTLISKSSLTNCLVAGSSIRGYNAGGFAGRINYSTPNNDKFNFKYKDHKLTISGNPDKTVSSCGVNTDVAIEGKNAGGFASIIDNGLISNCYTNATLRGIDGGSTKAGFAVDLNLSSSGNVGLIINSFTACQFEKSNGKNYAVSIKEIYLNPITDFGIEALKRDAGCCYDFVFVDRSGVTDPSYDEALLKGLKNIWDAISGQNNANPDRVSESSLKGTSKALTNRGFTTEYWNFNNDNYPTLKSLDNLCKNIESLLKGTHTITIPDHVTVTRYGKTLNNGDVVNKGDVLVISYNESERYTMSSFTINNVSFENNAKFTVGDSDVVINYEEIYTHFDINITPVANGTITADAYAKTGTVVNFNVNPATGYALKSVRVIAEDNTDVAVTDNSFIMPNKKVTIVGQFEKLYKITASNDVKFYIGTTEMTTDKIFAGVEIKVVPQDIENYVITEIIVSLVGVTGDGAYIYADGNGLFTMPENDVIIYITRKYMGVVTVETPNITISVDGTPTTDRVMEGKEVTIDVTPQTDYEVKTIIVTDSDGKSITVTNGNKFTMPNKDVEISVEYQPISE